MKASVYETLSHTTILKECHCQRNHLFKPIFVKIGLKRFSEGLKIFYLMTAHIFNYGKGLGC